MIHFDSFCTESLLHRETRHDTQEQRSDMHEIARAICKSGFNAHVCSSPAWCAFAQSDRAQHTLYSHLGSSSLVFWVWAAGRWIRPTSTFWHRPGLSVLPGHFIRTANCRFDRQYFPTWLQHSCHLTAIRFHICNVLFGGIFRPIQLHAEVGLARLPLLLATTATLSLLNRFPCATAARCATGLIS